MKGLLLAPILFSLLITNFALAGRPNPKKEAEKQEQKEYIVACNQSGKSFSSLCNKVTKSNRNKLTNEYFINSKKMDARRKLDKCTVLKDKKYCEKLSFKYWVKTERAKLDWIMEDMKEEEFTLIEKYADQYREQRSREVETWKKEQKDKKKEKSPLGKKIEAIRLCEDLIVRNLKDPNSYKRITSRSMQVETGLIEYTATNSFGGRVRESFRCYYP